MKLTQSLSPNHSLSNYSLIITAKKRLEAAATHHSATSAAIDLSSLIDQELGVIYPKVWKLIQTPTNLEEIYKAMIKEQQMDYEVREQDILCLIQKLAESGLIDIRIDIDKSS